ncbi:hypothetical protein FCMLKIFP_00112 [Pseudomonas phage Ka3]|uniref:Uncharacterized protein n=1 Tax=Pseudomonas phage KPP21 TaxID=1678082 RepID=A0A0H5B141_BPK21|nr:hypothetical protein AVU12_gp096 [Pseudomonas phage KPP21]QWY17797.1 hypothetical protein [Pseudomonas phage vB_Pae-PA152]UGL60911.1 hypothetical protein [Pseudomonas phage vB_PaeS_TUMS_P6]UNI71992.1 hypothetical protein [Pseudomonas phage vB_PaeP_TUMS_P10]WQZ52462.1 hypothetical protein FCMLKIFP_00112 [Pseudomonas phage Ka3]BAR94655.1 hypothetical protein [Pseudomonas phage KPP21]
MHIKLSPLVVLPGDSTEMTVQVSGDSVTVSGVEYDFSQLPEGGYLPATAVKGGPFSGGITREGGDIHLTLVFPIRGDFSEEAKFPKPVYIEKDGIVELPQ